MKIFYERALPYVKKKIDGRLGRKDETMQNVERSGLYLVFDSIIITLDELSRAGG